MTGHGDTTGKFELQDRILDRSDGFKIACGWWSGAGHARFCLAMRWSNAVQPPHGYPANQWFTLPHDISVKFAEMLQAWSPPGMGMPALRSAIEKLGTQEQQVR